MRDDSIGLWWQDIPVAGKRSSYAPPMPEIPDTGWRAPTQFPNLSRARRLAIDVETYDPELITHGPGWARGSGHIVGVSVATDDAGWYFPVRHETCPEQNMDPEHVFRWLRDTLSGPQPKVGANLLYDVGWLRQEGVHVAGRLYDVQFGEALLSETGRTSLDTLGKKYLNEGKTTDLLYQWLADWFGGDPDGKQRRHIHRAPPSLVGPYAIGDVDLPLRVLSAMYPKLRSEGLVELFEMENRLIPLLIEMRFKGVRVDLDRAAQLNDHLFEATKEKQAWLDKAAGFGVNVNAADSLAKLWQSLGLPIKQTKTGRPSFTKEVLAGVNHPVVEAITLIRKWEKMRGTFVDSYILGSAVNGRLHCQFHPMRDDGNGTRSGRFSSSHPNLQNIPSRDEELAPIVRGLFVPDEGHASWRRYDYSQIEYRFLVHYAEGPGAEEVRRQYREDPDTDYHVFTQELVYRLTKFRIERKPIKNLNFGLIYGMGVPKLCASLGVTREQGEMIFSRYHEALPYAKATMDLCSNLAARDGHITTILGRRSRFDLWEPTVWDKEAAPLPYPQAVARYGRVRRAMTHKALNRRLQGSAADMMKVAMLRCWEEGVFDRTGVPLLTVHDELDFTDPGTREAAEGFREVRKIMEEALPLRIPVRVDEEVGPNWGMQKG